MIRSVWACAAAVFGAVWCGAARGAEPTMRAVVSIPPLVGLVKPLLPQGSEVVSLLPAGASEHGFEMTPSAIAALARADLVVVVGMGLEPQIERALRANPRENRELLKMAEAVQVQGNALSDGGIEPALDGAHHDHEGHDHDHDHDHGGVDPHLWLDPVLVGKFVAPLRDSIIHAMRARGGMSATQTVELKGATLALEKQVSGVDGLYRERLAPFVGRGIVTHHDAFGRLAERYGLRVEAVLKQGETGEPTPATIAKVMGLARAGTISAVFVEPQSNPALARRISAETGVKVLTLDPLGEGEWATMMRNNLDALVEGLSGAPGR